MANQPQPVPPAGRSPKGPGDNPEVAKDTGGKPGAPDNPAQQGQQGNTKQNTTHQGYQQDR